ncbi:MAG: YhcH/YjgK/YiaL family protein [Bacteroidales bacterium]|nr:YhcH/YjgK/YiaL family protein [Bacteroidales bacterium]
MIIDRIENLGKYAALNPLFAKAADFLKTSDFHSIKIGKYLIEEGALKANCQQTSPKTREEAKIESHNEFIDIQLPLDGAEEMGFTPRVNLAEQTYNAEKDVTFYPGLAEKYFTIKPGEFAIFFPDDAHAPGVTPTGVRKIVFKVKV